MGIPVGKLLTVGMLPSPIKKKYYQLRGAKIGKRVKFSFMSLLDAEDIEIGDDVNIGLLAFVVAKKIKLGNRSQIRSMVAVDTGVLEVGADSIIMEQVVIGGMLTPRSALWIGKRVKIFPFSFLNTTQEIVIEDDVGIGGSNYIFTHGTWPSALDGYPYSFGPVTIKKGAWLPWRVFVMPNVTIGENSIVAAGSVVTSSVDDLSLVAGMPAKMVRDKGSYIRELSESKKMLLIKRIFNDFKDHYDYLEQEISMVTDGDNIDLMLNKTPIYFRKELDLNAALKSSGVFVSFKSLSIQQRATISCDGGVWFDLEQKETEFSLKKEWELVREYLGRYGIRFNVIGE